MTLIPVARYRPDVATLNTAYSGDIRNVFCAEASYLPAQELATFGGTLEDAPLGGIRVIDSAGTVRVFVGTAEKLFLMSNTDLTFGDVSQTAVTYSASFVSRWSFALFGNFVIAVNQNDDPQVYEIGTDTEFRDLGGSPPRAGSVKVWGDFVALMQLPGNPNRVQWSGLNDCEFWTPGTNNSDYQDFPDGGNVQGSSEATNPLIILQRSIYKCTFVPGSVEIFTFQKIHDKRGAKSSLSIASRGAYTFYADEGGFFQISPDGQLAPIGFEKVDRTFFNLVDSVSLGGIMGVVDPFHSRVYWVASTSGMDSYDVMFVYDWNIGEWTTVECAVWMIFSLATTGYTLDGLGDIYASIEDVPFSLDSRVWQGGSPVLGAFSMDYTLSAFVGTSMEAIIVTQEMGDTGPMVSALSDLAPVVDTQDFTVEIGARMRRSDTVVWSAPAAPSYNTGIVRKRSRARFHRFRTVIEAGAEWTHFQGIDIINRRMSGKR